MPHAPPTPDSRAIAAAISERNARIVLRGDAQMAQLLRFLFALALAIAGALLLVHYLTPCEGVELCVMGALTSPLMARPQTAPTNDQAFACHPHDPLHCLSYRSGYVAGTRWGIACGLLWGLLAGAALVACAFWLGWKGLS